MQSAFQIIKDTYDVETCKEIVDHGCVSGVAHDHIYYADTVKFYDEHEDEILTHVTETLGEDVLPQLFSEADASISVYKNSVVWTFIELVAMSISYEYDYSLELDYHIISSYQTA